MPKNCCDTSLQLLVIPKHTIKFGYIVANLIRQSVIAKYVNYVLIAKFHAEISKLSESENSIKIQTSKFLFMNGKKSAAGQRVVDAGLLKPDLGLNPTLGDEFNFVQSNQHIAPD